MARVSFRRCSRDVRSRAATAGGAGLALAATAAAGDADDVAGRGASDLGPPAAAVAAGSVPAFRGVVEGFDFVELISCDLASLVEGGCRPGVELTLPELGVIEGADWLGGAEEGAFAEDADVAPAPVFPAPEPRGWPCCSADCGGADAGEPD